MPSYPLTSATRISPSVGGSLKLPVHGPIPLGFSAVPAITLSRAKPARRCGASLQLVSENLEQRRGAS
jgi:hypothetical protein